MFVLFHVIIGILGFVEVIGAFFALLKVKFAEIELFFLEWYSLGVSVQTKGFLEALFDVRFLEILLFCFEEFIKSGAGGPIS